jgi:predicted amidohydrolase YtcJ
MRLLLIVIVNFVFLLSCSQKQKADLLVYHATIYTIDSIFSTAEAMVIKDGKITALGKLADLEKKYAANEKIDAGGKFIYPGFIDAHAHFLGYGSGLQTANLVGTNSWMRSLKR